MWRDGQQRSHTEIVRILHVIGMWRKSVESEKCVSCKFSKTEKNKSNGMEKRTKTDKKHTTKCRWLICRNVNADRDKYFLVRRHSSQLDSIQLLARKTPIFLSSFSSVLCMWCLVTHLLDSLPYGLLIGCHNWRFDTGHFSLSSEHSDGWRPLIDHPT